MKNSESDSFVWHEEFVKNLLSTGLPQALMVVGRTGDGLFELCMQLAKNTLAKNTTTKPQDITEEHPDLHVLRQEESKASQKRKNNEETENSKPDQEEDKKSAKKPKKLSQYIVIDHLRDLLEKISHSPFVAENKVAIIHPACRLHPSAANALLKQLEEPPLATIFILATERPHLLPATIRSRCRLVRAPRPTKDQAEKWLEKQKVKNAKLALNAANGQPLNALNEVANGLLQNTLTNEDLCEAKQDLAQLCTGQQKLVGPKKTLDNLSPTIWITWVLGWVEEIIYCLNNVNIVDEHFDVAKQLIKRQKHSVLAWLEIYDQLVRMHRIAEFPIVNRLLLERTIYLLNHKTN